MNSPEQVSAWIESQAGAMFRTVERWSGINSGTWNLQGLSAMEAELIESFGAAGVSLEPQALSGATSIDSNGNVGLTPLGRALRGRCGGASKPRVLLCIHYDTVYGASDSFQRPTRCEPHRLRGPGVVDAKGGIAVMLFALRAILQSAWRDRLALDIILNPDEEIGSPGSGAMLSDAARQSDVALLFEPALPGGSLVGARKGSGNYTVVVRGKAAHAGRDFSSGRSAILALAELITRLDSAQRDLPGVTINCGRIEGGGALNVVADLAIGRFNVRAADPSDRAAVEARLAKLIDEFSKREGIRVELHGGFHSPPKPLDERSIELFDLAKSCARSIGLDLDVRPSGGACDGNRVAAVGVPVIDSLGPRGGNLHSDQEFLEIDSLTERAKLTALLLIKLAERAIGR